MKCPGQDTRYWMPGDIFDVSCPQCGKRIEFFKDEVRRRCKSCGTQVTNPKIDFGCAEWCAYAQQCVGTLPVELKEKKQVKQVIEVTFKSSTGKRLAKALLLDKLDKAS